MLDNRHSARSAYQPSGATGRRHGSILFVYWYGMAGQSMNPNHHTAAVSCASVAKSIAIVASDVGGIIHHRGHVGGGAGGGRVPSGRRPPAPPPPQILRAA